MANVLYRRLKSDGAFVQATNTTSDVVMATHTIQARSIDKLCGFRVRALVETPSTNSTDTFALALKLGAVTLAGVAATNASNDDVWYVEFEGVLDPRNVVFHGSGTSDSTGTNLAHVLVADGAFNPAIDNAITLTGTWSVANAGNVANCKQFSIEIFPEDAE
jgi:hypothetical protein